jgi:hypothetical protein
VLRKIELVLVVARCSCAFLQSIHVARAFPPSVLPFFLSSFLPMAAAATATAAASASGTSESVFVDVPASHRAAFAEVLSALFFATHCHSCGKVCAVTLRGYVGRHCSRACWHSMLDLWAAEGNEMADDCIYGEECKSCSLLEMLSVARRVRGGR